MHDADAIHENKRLAEMLAAIYDLRSGDSRIALGFRDPYLTLLEKLGSPHQHLPPIIHVAGTNGKGSTIAFLRAMLEAAGYRVHVYTSPHLERFNERIRLAGALISDDELEALLDEVMAANGGAPATFFEITTALAFLAFSRNAADIVLLETGLGGKLDCTNIIENPIASVITPISMDHIEFLGDTIEKIAGEKAGIIKSGSKCIIGAQKTAARSVLKSKAEGLRNNIFTEGEDWFCIKNTDGMTFKCADTESHLPRPSLLGAHQISNAGTALACLYAIQNEFPCTLESMAKGLQNAEWPGRLERISAERLGIEIPIGWEIWYDGGHNEAAGHILAQQAADWQAQDGKPLHIILGMMRTKDPESFLAPLLPFATTINFVAASNDITAYQPGQLQEKLAKMMTHTTYTCDKFPESWNQDMSDGQGRVLICGSLYLKSRLGTFFKHKV